MSSRTLKGNRFSLIALFKFSAPALKERVTNVKQERNGITYLPNEEEPFTGKYEIFYSGGQKKVEGSYKYGKLEGLFISWFENGQKECETNYLKGEKQDGLSICWFENGQKSSERNFKDGTENGLLTVWNKSGQKIREVNYKDGIEVIK